MSVAGGGRAVHSAKTQAGDNGLSSKPKRSGVTVNPGSVTVAVLNGTTVNGLAAALRDQIAAAGFRTGTINVFSDQQLAESVVQYAPGHEAEAKAVSRRVGIGQREPVNPSSKALAGDATVIVIAGADKAP
jgi:tRNA A37 threonylcarbamoyladenosine dehydratase